MNVIVVGGGTHMKKNNMEKCKSCVNFDKEKSNKNWTVCKCIPVEVMISKSSENCKAYIKE